MCLLHLSSSLPSLANRNVTVSFLSLLPRKSTDDSPPFIRFFAFNWYRLGVGTDYEWYCSSENSKSVTLEVRNEEIDGNSTLESLSVSSVDYQKNTTVFIVAYPCEFGFHYLVSGAAVWLAFLPFYLTQLLGNCWRQCCCCLCDPLVSIIT